ncbi:DUF1493 family protein [Pantoea agglomerans]|uniref:DUF1493 family protein n=1 Tax=Enterobacter agglomerans TaxID=549 RepID=UPI0013C5BE09|nr:DUF1493 family protein [Pantoea agglomerans]NEG61032.1 DUF1493 family protein [Pantoea agglomerans]
MVDDVEQRVFALARRYCGVYLFNNDKKQKLLNHETDLDTDMLLDIGEAEELMDDYFEKFHVSRGNFRIETYYPDEPLSWNPFKKALPVPVPDFTLGMLIESAKAGKWLYE